MWALVGVVVGALLGGGAQIIAGVLTDRRAHRRWLREQRVDVYRAVLDQTDRTITALWESQARAENESPFDYDFTGGVDPHLSALDLFGDSSVAQAGHEVARTFNAMADQTPRDVDMVPIQQARDAYLAAVRADLGVE